MTARELKSMRRDSGLSQAEVALELGIHVMTVSRWERGSVTIPVMSAHALRAYFSGKVGAKTPRTTSSKSKIA